MRCREQTGSVLHIVYPFNPKGTVVLVCTEVTLRGRNTEVIGCYRLNLIATWVTCNYTSHKYFLPAVFIFVAELKCKQQVFFDETDVFSLTVGKHFKGQNLFVAGTLNTIFWCRDWRHVSQQSGSPVRGEGSSSAR